MQGRQKIPDLYSYHYIYIEMFDFSSGNKKLINLGTRTETRHLRLKFQKAQMGPTRVLGRSCGQRGERRGHTRAGHGAGHSLGSAGSVSTGQTGTQSQGRAPGTGQPHPKAPGAEPCCGQGSGWPEVPGGTARGYLDTVLQAVAHGRADLLEVTEQRG